MASKLGDAPTPIDVSLSAFAEDGLSGFAKIQLG
jgi:hypothetical protein